MGKNSGLTKRQKRVFNRKNLLCNLAEAGKIFCEHHSQTLAPEEISSHRCYIGNNGKRVCSSIRVLSPYQKFVSYKEWSSNER